MVPHFGRELARNNLNARRWESWKLGEGSLKISSPTTSSNSVFQQSVIHKRLADLRFACRIHHAHREPQFTRITTQKLHCCFHRDWVCRDAQHVAAEREEFPVPL